LDPIADKLLLSSSFFVLSLNGKIPWWLTILVLGRDVLILAVCATVMLVSGYRSFPPSLLGKLTTFVEILWVLVVILDEVLQQRWVEIAHGWGIYLVAVLAVGSGLHYGIRLARQQTD